jgi:hypothetical protein
MKDTVREHMCTWLWIEHRVTSGEATRSLGAYHGTALSDRSYTAAEVDAALAALVEPGRLAHAQDVVVHSAPALQRVLVEALAEGGWFGEAHDAEVSRIAGEHDEGECARAVSTLVAEQTRLGMFVGVAVGFQLAHELADVRESASQELGRKFDETSSHGESADSESANRELSRKSDGTPSYGKSAETELADEAAVLGAGGLELQRNQTSTEEH